jgi:sterol desaturase/sphingolipid hydroxylase (fatty acid hydroxylase superfamily)
MNTFPETKFCICAQGTLFNINRKLSIANLYDSGYFKARSKKIISLDLTKHRVFPMENREILHDKIISLKSQSELSMQLKQKSFRSLSMVIWSPIAFLLPIALLALLDSGGITFNEKYYAFNNLYRWAWHGSLMGSGVVLAVFLTELLCVGWKDSSLRLICFGRTASSWSDIAIFVATRVHFTQFLSAILTFGASFLTFDWLRSRIVDTVGFDPGLNNLSFVPQFLVGLILYSFLDYWTHRFEHTNIIWPLHRFHHAAEDFCILTAFRIHPFGLTGLFIVNAPIVLLGISPPVLLAVNVVITYVRYLIHSRIPGQWGWFGNWVLQSADSHRKHHILDEAQAGKNFSLMPLWDHLFGTWSPACSNETPIGVHFPYRQGAWFLPDLWRDYCQFGSNIYEACSVSLLRQTPASNQPDELGTPELVKN